MKKMKWLLVLVCALMLTDTSFAARRLAKHVILIGMDGWGSYSVEKAEIPTIKKIMAEGAYTLKKRSVLPSSSAVNWASMFMGAGPEIHGYTRWYNTKPDLPSRVVNEHGIFPTIFSELRKVEPDAEIGMLYNWGGMKYVCDSMAMSTLKQVKGKPLVDQTAKAACEYIIKKKPMLGAIIFDEPDNTGHGRGHDTPAYYAKLKELDKAVAEIVEAIKKAGIYDDTILILSADHGGINKGHGGKTMLEMEAPFIIFGKNVKKGLVIEESMMQFDIAATIAYIFRLEQPQAWIGRPMKQVFK